MLLKTSFGTHIGQRRETNQDNGGVFPELGFVIVADGMGGHQGGETASRMATEQAHRYIRDNKLTLSTSPEQILRKGIISANSAIYDVAQNDSRLHGMGTTVTSLLFQGNTLYVGHAGDSRCYFIRPQAIWQLTRDHSLVQEKFRAGLITREQTKTDVMKNVITRSVGFEPMVDVDIYEMEVGPGDVFLVCSDGLTGMVDDLDILKTVEEKFFQQGSLDETIKTLLSLANSNGGDDNITVAMVQLAE